LEWKLWAYFIAISDVLGPFGYILWPCGVFFPYMLYEDKSGNTDRESRTRESAIRYLSRRHLEGVDQVERAVVQVRLQRGHLVVLVVIFQAYSDTPDIG
jgi:hypothetical protein